MVSIGVDTACRPRGRRTSSVVVALVAVAVALVGAAGCGSGGDSDSSSAPAIDEPPMVRENRKPGTDAWQFWRYGYERGDDVTSK